MIIRMVWRVVIFPCLFLTLAFFAHSSITRLCLTRPDIARQVSDPSRFSVQRSGVLLFGQISSDCVLKENEFPSSCSLRSSQERRPMKVLTENDTLTLDEAFALYEAECNRMIFGEGVKRKFVLFRPNRNGIGNRFQEFAVAVALAMLTGRHIAIYWRLPTHFDVLFDVSDAGFELDFSKIEAVAFPPPSNAECSPYSFVSKFPLFKDTREEFKKAVRLQLDRALREDVDVIVVEGYDQMTALMEVMRDHPNLKDAFAPWHDKFGIAWDIGLGWKALSRWVKPSRWTGEVMNKLLRKPFNSSLHNGFRVEEPTFVRRSADIVRTNFSLLCLQVRTGIGHTSWGKYVGSFALQRFAECSKEVIGANSSRVRIVLAADDSKARDALLSLLRGFDVVFVDYPSIHSGYEHGCKDGSGEGPTLAAHVHTVAEFMMFTQCDGLILSSRSSFGTSGTRLSSTKTPHLFELSGAMDKCPSWRL